MVTTMAMSPATAQTNCFDRNAYSEPKRSRAMTADAENTITRPTNTSSMVTVNSQRSTLTRFAMGSSFHHGDAEPRTRKSWIVEFCLLIVLVLGFLTIGTLRGREQQARHSSMELHITIANLPGFDLAKM